jgi:hypothetical protein
MLTHRDIAADAAQIVAGGEAVITRGACYLARAGEWFAMSAPPTFHPDGGSTPGASHRLAVAETDEARLAAHWGGFLANNGVRVLPNYEGTTLKAVKARLRDERAKAEAELAADLRKARREGTPRAALVGREVEVIACLGDERVEPFVWYASVGDLTKAFLDACAARAREAGATHLSIGGGLDWVYDVFNRDDYEPWAAAWSFELAL